MAVCSAGALPYYVHAFVAEGLRSVAVRVEGELRVDSDKVSAAWESDRRLAWQKTPGIIDLTCKKILAIL